MQSERIKIVPTEGGFSAGEIKRAKKALKKAGIPKPWLTSIVNKETGEELVFELV